MPDFAPRTPSIARVYDYLLNGKDHFAADREVAQRLLAIAPLTAQVTRENRLFLVRAVTCAANRGISHQHDSGHGQQDGREADEDAGLEIALERPEPAGGLVGDEGAESGERRPAGGGHEPRGIGQPGAGPGPR